MKLFSIILLLFFSSINFSPDAIITVSNGNDSGAGSLRQAIQDANASPADDTIVFANGVVTVTLTSGELLINSNITIVGNSSAPVTITRSAAVDTPNFRIFNIAANTNVSLTYLTISGGKTLTFSERGAGIYNAGNTSISNTTISNNVMPAPNSAGGGINNVGTLSLTNSSVESNLVGCKFCSSNDRSGAGAGIFNTGTIALINSRVTGNQAFAYFLGAPGSIAVASGGGIYNSGTANVTNSMITGNLAEAAFALGAGIYNDNILNITGSTISSNTALGNGSNINSSHGGAGIFSVKELVISNSTVSDNIGQSYNNVAGNGGGGIYVRGTATLNSVTITGNRSLITNSADYDTGGGLTVNGTVRISNSTVTGNLSGAGVSNSSALAPSDVLGMVISEGYNVIGIRRNSSGWIATDQVGEAATSTPTPTATPFPTPFPPTPTPTITPTPSPTPTPTPTTTPTPSPTTTPTPFPPTPFPCTYSINPASQNVAANGGSVSFTVTTQTGCSFTTISNNDFISVDYGATGTGSSNVGIFVLANNTGATRTGTLTIGGQTFTVNQAANEKKRIRLRIP